MLPVDGQVVVLVARPGGLVKRGWRTHLGQRARQQVLAALAHGARDEGAADRRQSQVGQGARQRHLEVTDGVDHGAVEIDDGGLEGPLQQEGGLHATDCRRAR
jgi:hypothetical protein